MTHPQHPPCAHLRELVKDCLSKHMYESASFFADKLVTLSGHAPADVWLLAQVCVLDAHVTCPVGGVLLPRLQNARPSHRHFTSTNNTIAACCCSSNQVWLIRMCDVATLQPAA